MPRRTQKKSMQADLNKLPKVKKIAKKKLSPKAAKVAKKASAIKGGKTMQVSPRKSSSQLSSDTSNKTAPQLEISKEEMSKMRAVEYNTEGSLNDI